MKTTIRNWKNFAVALYFKQYGRRCVICSTPVDIAEAHLEVRDTEIYLMHKECIAKENACPKL